MDRRKIIFLPKIKKQKKDSFSQTFFRFMLFVFLGAVIYILFFSNLLQISSIKINGNEYTEEENILSETNLRLEGKYLGIVPKNNLLLFKKDSLKKSLLDKFKQIRNVQIKKDFPSGLVISIQEREMKMVLDNGTGQYLIDENGQAYDKAKKDNLIILTDGSGKEINLGDMVLNPNYINYIFSLKGKLKDELDLEIENGFWTPSIISNDIRLKTKENWSIYFNGNEDLKKEIEMLKTVLKKEIQPDQRANLDYIDLRIDNKIYYKFK